MRPTGALLLLLTIVIVDAQPGLRSLPAIKTEVLDVWSHDLDRACAVLQRSITQYETAINDGSLTGNELSEARETLPALKRIKLVNLKSCGQSQDYQAPGLRSLSAIRTEVLDVWSNDLDRACAVLQRSITQYETAINGRLSGIELAEAKSTLAALKKIESVNFITCGQSQDYQLPAWLRGFTKIKNEVYDIWSKDEDKACAVLEKWIVQYETAINDGSLTGNELAEAKKTLAGLKKIFNNEPEEGSGLHIDPYCNPKFG